MSNKGTGGPLGDYSLPLRLGTLFLRWQDAELESGGTSLGAGAAVLDEIGTTTGSPTGTESLGIEMGAAGDEVYWQLPVANLPFFDPSQDIALRVHFFVPNADSGIVWKAFVKGYAAGADFSDVLSSPDASLTFDSYTALGADRDYTEFKACDCAGTFGAGTTAATQYPGASADMFLGFVAECDDLGTASADEIQLIGLEIKYGLTLIHPSGVRQTV